MARKEDMSDNSKGAVDYGIFAINETSVGRGGQNSKRSDIQLVQFFLRDFFSVNSELAVSLPQTKNGLRPVAIDGKYGSQTEKAIFIFQRYVQTFGHAIKVDGLVSVPKDIRSSSGKVYTIILLNSWFQKNGKAKEYHGQLENNPDINVYAPDLNIDLTLKGLTNEF